MAAPGTVKASGHFAVTRAGANAGEGVLRMRTATRGTLTVGGTEWRLTGRHGTRVPDRRRRGPMRRPWAGLYAAPPAQNSALHRGLSAYC